MKLLVKINAFLGCQIALSVELNPRNRWDNRKRRINGETH